MKIVAKTGSAANSGRTGECASKPGPAGGRSGVPLAVPAATGAEDGARVKVHTFEDAKYHVDHGVAAKDDPGQYVGSIDFCWFPEIGFASIRKQDGTRLTYHHGIAGLGPKIGEPFLQDILWATGKPLDEQATRRFFASPAGRAARLLALRKALGESARHPWYLVLQQRPWRIWWDCARSWRFIEFE